MLPVGEQYFNLQKRCRSRDYQQILNHPQCEGGFGVEAEIMYKAEESFCRSNTLAQQPNIRLGQHFIV